MTRIGTVWDSAVEAVRGRSGVILPIAVLAVFLPSVIQAAMQSYFGQPAGGAPGAGRALLVMILSIALMVLTLWGALAITAITSRPDVTRAEAGRLASARLLPLIGVSLMLALALGLLALPVVGLFASAGVNVAQMSTPGFQPRLSGGSAAAAGLYLLALAGLLLWVFARLMPLVPIVLHERLGVRAIGRAFRLTKGMGAKLVGVLLLYLVVLGVATFAAQAIVGLIFRLVLGADNVATATFLGGVAGAAVSTVLSVLSYAFVARLYAMRSGRDLADVFEDARAAT